MPYTPITVTKPAKRKTRINPRITIKKHEREVAVLRELLEKSNEELHDARVELLLQKWSTGNWRAAYKSVRSRLDEAMTDIRYAHSNVRCGNVEEAGKYLSKARKTLNQ